MHEQPRLATHAVVLVQAQAHLDLTGLEQSRVSRLVMHQLHQLLRRDQLTHLAGGFDQAMRHG